MLSACVLARPAFAIPSPDIVVSAFSNAAQILGVLTVAIGGALVSRRSAVSRNRGRGAGGRNGGSRKLVAFLGLAVIVLVAINVMQWANAVDSRQSRLQANLVRTSLEAGKWLGDVSLKTLPFSGQINHPLGISTTELESLLASGKSRGDGKRQEAVFIDVRESEEWEMGTLEGFAHVRYPELMARAKELKLAGKRAVLLCHSGNRSSELCDTLRAAGIDCRFVVGGYEKWLAEGRTARFAAGSKQTSLRPLPAFPSADVLLDTPDVQRLVANRKAVFVDVRYPEEFSRGHLPNAINMPIRKMTTAELDAAFAKLPDGPVVAPCYDKRSCFYAQILGLRLHRRGVDFQGRYTVPGEYAAPSPSQSYVQRWLGTQERDVLGMIRRPFDYALTSTLQQTGSLVLAIFLVLVALRFLLLPFTAKGERDQIVERRLRDVVSALERKIQDDPQRLQRAIRAVRRRERLTPGRNLIGIAIQLVLLIALFSSVATLAAPNSETFLWIPDVGRPDPYFLLPILLGALVFAQLQVSAGRHAGKWLQLRLLAAAFFIGLTVGLKAALTLYLIFGLTLMLLQTAAVRWLIERPQRPGPAAAKPLPARIAPLELAHRIPDVGTKARRIALMVQAGLPVPRGLVIPDAAFCDEQEGTSLCGTRQRRLRRLCRRLGLRRMAVRSSGRGEDGSDHSLAGVFESILDVDRDGLGEAVERVRRSLQSSDMIAHGEGVANGGGVIVQQLVDADYAGVLFTEHPTQSGTMLVEMTAGLGDKVAGGTAEPDSYGIGRVTLEQLDGSPPPIDLAPLIALGLRVEQLFGQPQDIEWAYKKGRFCLLQARDITVLARSQAAGPVSETREQGLFEKERHRLLEVAGGKGPAEEVLVQNELSELLPRPTPLSLSFMEMLWKPGGSVDLACRALGVPYQVGEDASPYLVSVFGRLYVDAAEQRRRTGKGLGPLASFRLSRAARDLEQDFREGFLPGYLADLRMLEAVDFARVGTDDLFDLLEDICDRYRRESHVQVDIINIAADFYVQAAKRELEKRRLASGSCLGLGKGTAVHQAMELLQGVSTGSTSQEDFLAFFGHRSPVDYELAEPRYREDDGLVKQLMRDASAMTYSSDDGRAAPELPQDRRLAIAVDRARKFQVLKEEAKHTALREFAEIRRMLLELDRRLDLDGGIFHLELDEIFDLRRTAGRPDLVALIGERRAAAAVFEALPPLQSSLSPRDVERLDPSGDGHGEIDGGGDLKGVLVAGDTSMVGRARVLTEQGIDTVEDGEIVVARYMHPSWIPALPRLKGIVTEVGGWLSHTSILAREYNITTIIGVKGAEYGVKTGDVVKLNLDGTVEVVERRGAVLEALDPRRGPQSVPCAANSEPSLVA